MKRITILSLLLCPLLLVFGPASAAKNGKDVVKPSHPPSALTKAIKQVGPSVVQITIRLKHYPERTREALQGRVFLIDVLGSGFLVSEDGYVITAKHVIDAIRAYTLLGTNGEELDLGERAALVGIPMPNMGEIGQDKVVVRGSFSDVSFDEIDEDPIHDIALLKLKGNPFAQNISERVMQ